MAEKIVLEATRRDVFGKRVRHLRSEGLVPGVVYGPTFESVPVQIEWLKLRPVLRAAGGSHLIQLQVAGEEFNTLVREVQRDPLRGEVLHIDFYRVRMDVAVRADVPLSTTGSDTAITKNGGVLLQEMTTITVECLPTDLPALVPVDVSVLKQVGDSILVKDLPVLPGVTYLADPSEMVISTSAIMEREEEEEAAAASAEPELIRRKEEEVEED
jgi:large subunit ribosomal protein L25